MVAQQEPRPPPLGRPVRGSRTGRPMAALDLLGRRWARLLRELRGGPLGARALRSRCDAMSSSVLYQLLHELDAPGLVGRDDADRYPFSPIAGGAAIASLHPWARQWAGTSVTADGGAAG
jgi:hypothetical protein